MKHKMFQTGTINSLLQAVYDGDMSIAQMQEHGDFGLGTFDAVDGELIALDGNYYYADENGKLSLCKPQIKTPFAVVTKFNSVIFEQEISEINFAQLEHYLVQQFKSQNLIYAIKITGKFKKITMRSEACQPRPYQKLAISLPKLQNVFEHSELGGSLVGVWFPKYLASLNVPGFHFHFVDDARTIGGHVFAFELESGTVSVQEHHDFALSMIASEEYYQANLNQENSADVASVEQIRS